MSCLDATFTLTPQSPSYSDSSLNNYAQLYCFGADFWFDSPRDLSSLYASNRFYFHATFAADPNLNYAPTTDAQVANLFKTRWLQAYIKLGGYAGTQKQLALIFGFDVFFSNAPGRVLVYSDAALLKDQQLVYGDNQFLLEIESLDLPFYVYFIHAGGYWFFRGLSGYVV
jgi:hypothetical protein